MNRIQGQTSTATESCGAAEMSASYQAVEETAKRAVVAAKRSHRCIFIGVRVEIRPVDGPTRFTAELTKESALHPAVAFTEGVDRV
jgi:hypothetical protein